MASHCDSAVDASTAEWEFCGISQVCGLDQIYGVDQICGVAQVARHATGGRRPDSALPGLEPRFLLVDHEHPATAPDDLGTRLLLQRT